MKLGNIIRHELFQMRDRLWPRQWGISSIFFSYRFKNRVDPNVIVYLGPRTQTFFQVSNWPPQTIFQAISARHSRVLRVTSTSRMPQVFECQAGLLCARRNFIRYTTTKGIQLVKHPNLSASPTSSSSWSSKVRLQTNPVLLLHFTLRGTKV